MLAPQLPGGEGQTPAESEAPEEVVERLAHLEQLVVQLKELIRDRDTQLIQKDTELANKDVQLKVNDLCVCQSTVFFMPTSFMTEHLFFFCFLSAEWERGSWGSLHQTQTAGQSQDGFAQQTDIWSERTRRSTSEFEWGKAVDVVRFLFYNKVKQTRYDRWDTSLVKPQTNNKAPVLCSFIWLERPFCLQQSPDSSFTGAGAAVEEELQELKNKLSQEEANSRELQERLQTSEERLREKESAHAEEVTQPCL